MKGTSQYYYAQRSKNQESGGAVISVSHFGKEPGENATYETIFRNTG